MKNKICNKCNKKFRHDEDLDEHLDVHTPYWTGKKITLSGADQIRLIIKNMYHNWDYFLKHELKRKNAYDYMKAIQIRDFEKSNNVKFIVKGEVISFKELNNV